MSVLKIVFIILVSHTFAIANYYPGGKLRLPFGALSQASGGIGLFTGMRNEYYNPAISYGRNTLIKLSATNYSLDREEASIGVAFPLDKHLALSFNYMYRGIRGIDIYNESQEIETVASDLMTIFNGNLSVFVFNKPNFGNLRAGAGLNFLSERLDLNVESSDRFTYAENRALLYNGSFGILWQINNFELAASLLQIGARDRWSVSTSISAQERETQDITVDVPLKGLVGARRYISDSLFVVSLQIDVEKVAMRSEKIIGRAAIEFNPDFFVFTVGYGDQRASVSAGVLYEIFNRPIHLRTILFTDKLTGINYGFYLESFIR